jgi:hypothetical protein
MGLLGSRQRAFVETNQYKNKLTQGAGMSFKHMAAIGLTALAASRASAWVCKSAKPPQSFNRPHAHPMNRLHTTLKLCAIAIIGASYAVLASAQVFQTPAEFQVTDAGAASYTIPIAVPPGAGKLEPSLALQYNSQSGNSAFGVGWSLTGVSSITRCPKNYAEEGDRVAVKNDATDLFCLDGQKLRAVSGAYGASGTKYRTARDSYSQVTSNGLVGGGPANFVVQTRDGAVMEFGATADSQLEHPSKGVVRTWMLSKISDRFGNSVKFAYYKDPNAGQQVLASVDYSNGVIQLHYETRPSNDFIVRYDDGVPLGSVYVRATKIEVYEKPVLNSQQQNRLFKEYRLSYVQSPATQRSLLASVRECAPGDVCLPQINLGYQSHLSRTYVAGGAVSPDASLYVDRQGDGIQAAMSDDDILALTGIPRPYSFYPGGTVRISLLAWDIDGDSKTDFQATTIKKHDGGSWSYYRRNQASVQWLSRSGTLSSLSTPNSRVMCFADLQGDGNSEPIYIHNELAKGPHTISIGLTGPSTLVSSYASAIVGVPSDTTITRGACQAIDVDGDGRSEIYFSAPGVIGSSAVIAYRGGALQHLGAHFGPELHTPSVFTNPNGFPKWSMYGDFNGDGKTDVLSSIPGSKNMGVHLSRGTPLPWAADWITAIDDPYSNAAQARTCTGDFNGDGRTDLLVYRPTPNGWGAMPIHLYQSVTNGFTQVELTGLPWIQNDVITCGDFNGDGLTDIAVKGNYYWSSTPGAVDVLNVVTDATQGYRREIAYKSITDNSVYTKGSGAVYPEVDLQTPIQVVARVSSHVAAQGTQHTNYRYEHLRSDLKRSGTLGFARVISTNENTGISHATTYHQKHPLIGLRVSEHEYLGNQTLGLTEYTYLQRGIGVPAPTAQAAQVQVNGLQTKKYDLNGAPLIWSNEYSDSIDGFGNVLISRMEHRDANGNPTSRKTTTNTYLNDANRWLIGQLTRSNTRSENLRPLPATDAGPIIGHAPPLPPAPPPTPLTPGQKAALSAIMNLLLSDE